VYGVDIVSDAILIGKNYHNPLNLIVADMHQLPFADKVFTVVICTGVLEHAYDVKAVVAEMHRVMKRGGVLLLEVPDGIAGGIDEGHLLDLGAPDEVTSLFKQFKKDSEYKIGKTNGFAFRRIEW
jgi:ubiquinone/menaquinone biosynthesis C-methylase UbiE